MGIVAAGEEMLDGLADPLQAEAAMGGGIGVIVGGGRGRGSGGIGAHG